MKTRQWTTQRGNCRKEVEAPKTSQMINDGNSGLTYQTSGDVRISTASVVVSEPAHLLWRHSNWRQVGAILVGGYFLLNGFAALIFTVKFL